MPRMSELEYQSYLAKHAPKEERERKALAAELEDEKALHGQIINWLRVKGVRAVIHSRMDKRTGQQIGTADFHFVVHGVPCCVEAKVGTNQLTAEQVGWMEAAKLDGWLTCLARSLDDVIAIYREAETRGTKGNL